MRYDTLHIAAVGAYYPKSVPVDEAIARGDYSTQAQESTGLRSVAIAGDDDTQPVMAVRAGRLALRRSGYPPDRVGLLLHAVTSYNGLDGWNVGAYLQREVLDGHGLSFEIRQLSNGCLASVELAAHHLLAAHNPPTALVSATDRFEAPFWNRWTSNVGMVFGDGASAAVLSREGGFARVLSLITVCDPGLEGLQRGNLPFRPGPDPDQFPVSLWLRSLEFFDSMDPQEADERMADGLRAAATTAAREAGMAIGDAAHYVVPNFGRELVRKECLDPLDIDLERTTWEWGRQVGHCGTADQFGGLNHLVESGVLAAGDRVMLISVGGGFNWTCMIIEMVQAPNLNSSV